MFTVELPPDWSNGERGRQGFILEEARIKSSCQEAWAGVEAVLDYLAKISVNSARSFSHFNILIFMAFLMIIQ